MLSYPIQDKYMHRTVWTLLKKRGLRALYLSDQSRVCFSNGTSTLNWASSSFIPSRARLRHSLSSSSWPNKTQQSICNTQCITVHEFYRQHIHCRVLEIEWKRGWNERKEGGSNEKGVLLLLLHFYSKKVVCFLAINKPSSHRCTSHLVTLLSVFSKVALITLCYNIYDNDKVCTLLR